MTNKDLKKYIIEYSEETINNNTTKKSVRPKPNMIWIVVDQMRASSIAINGDPNVRTPNIDMLAKTGINFNSAVSGYPICCPFRGTMLTGLTHNKCVPGHQYRLPVEQTTIADIFNQNGYDTAYFGKWHLDGCRQEDSFHIVPFERRGRFNTWIGYENNACQYNVWVHGHKYGQEIKQYQLKGYETNELTNLLIDYINDRGKNPDKPFFAVLSVIPPHPPYVAPSEQLQNYKWNDMILRKNVPSHPDFEEKAKKELTQSYAMIQNIDINVGKIMESLRENDIDLNTNIMFFSDHGDMLNSHGGNGKVVPYEESIRIPFIVSGAIPNYFGYRTGESDALLSDLDIVPTTLGLCSIPVPDYMHGYDYSYIRYSPNNEFKEKSKNEPDSAFIEAIMPRENCDKAWRAVVTRDGWKYATFENEEWLMFNLNNDPYEQNNLAHANYLREKRKELNKKIKEYINKTEDSFELPDSRFFG